MMTIDELIEQKNKSGLTYAQIAAISGVPIGTVQKVLGRITPSPRLSTLAALEKALTPDNDANTNCIREDEPFLIGKISYTNSSVATASKKPGEYTLEDYYALPDDHRVELIDGVFYDMSAPSTVHQIIAFNISMQFKKYIDSNKGNCMVFMAPCDVQLDKDDKTMVQPDVMVVCDRDKIVKRNIYGCPDFIVEISSPSTKRKDLSIKLTKYLEAGVKEYWIVDPDKLKIIVYTLGEDTDVSIYGFEDKIPVAMYDRGLEVDFKPILDEISFLL